MNSVFNEQILADKLSKLNSTQQCIENLLHYIMASLSSLHSSVGKGTSLSHWCIFHRKKAELVVQTWDKQFHSSQKEQKVPFLYLANDILQNSRRKGTEFVSEFWKVLPAALKDVAENGDERGKNTVSRLVGIWEERRVFGSRAKDLKNLMLGNEPPPPLELNRKRSRAVRIVKRDSRSIKIKLAIGGTVEKIVSAFHSVLSEHPNEETDLNNCKAAVRRVGKMEKDVDNACLQKGDPRRTTLADELQEEETLLKQCIEKLKSVEETRAALVSQLKEALQGQESELENVRTQLQVAQAQVEEAINMRRRLSGDTSVACAKPSSSSATSQINQSASAGETPKKTAAAIAAEVADKLAASTSSQQIMTSVLSTFAAQEAKNASLTASNNACNNTFPSEKRPKLETQMPVPDASTFVAAQTQPVPATHQHPTVFVHQPSIQAQAPTSQPQYTMLATPPSHQYLQPSGAMMIGVPYGYGTLPPPPPPLPPAHMVNLARPPLTQQPMPLQQALPLTQQQPVPLTLQQSTTINLQQQLMPSIQQQQPAPSFRPLQPPSMTFYSHPHHPQ